MDATLLTMSFVFVGTWYSSSFRLLSVSLPSKDIEITFSFCTFGKNAVASFLTSGSTVESSEDTQMPEMELIPESFPVEFPRCWAAAERYTCRREQVVVNTALRLEMGMARI